MNDSSYTVIENQTVRLLDSREEPAANVQHVFIIGSKGIPAAYGGFETFVDQLTAHRVSDRIHYHVARLAKDNLRFDYHGATVFDVAVPNIRQASAIWYDVAALHRCIAYCKAHPQIKRPVFYVLACRIGPFIGHFRREIHKLGGVLLVNPDGHEWLRAKWSAPVRKYWKVSEGLMTKAADLLVCDSKHIEQYIQSNYKKYRPHTTFIAYGANIGASTMKDDDPAFAAWLQKHGLTAGGYYLVVGRLVPENNYETMLRGFMQARTTRKLVLITNDNPALLAQLKESTGCGEDARIVFAGSVYDAPLLSKIREQAHGYLHGHEVGGTNPSLLEALGATDVNLLLGVGFNREVGEDAALYWEKDPAHLAALLDRVDGMAQDERRALGKKAKARIAGAYSWPFITDQYEKLFLQSIEVKP